MQGVVADRDSGGFVGLVERIGSSGDTQTRGDSGSRSGAADLGRGGTGASWLVQWVARMRLESAQQRLRGAEQRRWAGTEQQRAGVWSGGGRVAAGGSTVTGAARAEDAQAGAGARAVQGSTTGSDLPALLKRADRCSSGVSSERWCGGLALAR